jgi:hypothetical protein
MPSQQSPFPERLRFSDAALSISCHRALVARRLPLIALTLISSICVSRTSVAQQLSNSIVVRSYDTAGVPANTIEEARVTVAELLDQAGMSATWRDCRTPDGPMSRSRDRCDDVLGARELVVRIVAAPRTISNSETLGYSHVDVRMRMGTLATVFADRVRDLARELHVSEGTLLGRAMTHEIGHLLLGTLDHSQSGLMREHWSSRGRAADWIFSSTQALRIRDGLMARMRTDDVFAMAGMPLPQDGK